MSDFVVDILEDFLGEPRKHNEGKNQIAFDCPACSADKGKPEGDGKGNLEVQYGTGVFKCWACKDTNNMYGVIPRLIRRYGTAQHLKDYLLLKPEFVYNPDEVEKKLVLSLPRDYISLSTNNNEYNRDQAMKYLKGRNITKDIIDRFEIGFCNRGEYKNRIIIPSRDSDGNINYFTSRGFNRYAWPKYLNPDADKDIVVFNENKINWDATVYLVEGPFDHIVLPNSIPLLGKILSDYMLNLLYLNAKVDIVIVLDGDAYKDAVRYYKKLNFGKLHGRIKVVKVPEKYDVSEIYERLGAAGIVKLLKWARVIPENEL
jgi:DNA primase